MKPLQPTKLKIGQALGVAEGFADTYNWVVDATDNLHGDGTYISVNKTIPESPEIQLNIDAVANLLDGISGGCSCEMSAYYNTGYKLATFDNGRTQTDIYAPSSGGYVSSYTTLSGNVPGSQKISGDVVFEAMTSSNVSVETVV